MITVEKIKPKDWVTSISTLQDKLQRKKDNYERKRQAYIYHITNYFKGLRAGKYTGQYYIWGNRYDYNRYDYQTLTIKRTDLWIKTFTEIYIDHRTKINDANLESLRKVYNHREEIIKDIHDKLEASVRKSYNE